MFFTANIKRGETMEEQERNSQLLNDLAQGNITDEIDEIDVATPIEGAYIPDTVNFEASRNERISEKMAQELSEQAQRDVEELIAQTEEKLSKFKGKSSYYDYVFNLIEQEKQKNSTQRNILCL